MARWVGTLLAQETENYNVQHPGDRRQNPRRSLPRERPDAAAPDPRMSALRMSPSSAFTARSAEGARGSQAQPARPAGASSARIATARMATSRTRGRASAVAVPGRPGSIKPRKLPKASHGSAGKGRANTAGSGDESSDYEDEDEEAGGDLTGAIAEADEAAGDGAAAGAGARLTEVQIQEYRATFDLFDGNKDGVITKAELQVRRAALCGCGRATDTRRRTARRGGTRPALRPRVHAPGRPHHGTRGEPSRFTPKAVNSV